MPGTTGRTGGVDVMAGADGRTATTTTTPPSPGPPPALWRQRNFAALWSAHTVSQFGTQLSFFVLPVLALTTVGATPGQVGLVSAAETLPFLLIGLPAGALLDQWDRRRVMVVADAGRAVALGVVPLGHALGVLSVPLLCAVAFVTGLFTVFFDIADQAFLPAVVGRHQVADANSRLEFSRSAADLAGPGLSGLLLQWAAAPLILLADAASYLVSALLLGAIRPPRPPAGPVPAPAAREPMRTRIAEGLRFVFRHRALRSLVLASALANLAGFGGALSALLPAFALRDLGLSPGRLGLALTVGNACALLGALFTARLAGVFGVGRVLLAARCLPGLGVLLLATAGPGRAVPTLAVAAGLLACGSTAYNIVQVSLRQAVTPAALQARMNASVRFVIWGALPLGAAAGGLLGSAVGPRAALWTVAAVSLLSVLPPLLTREVRALRDFPGAEVG
ncbi:MFS transporter [Kitasatospora sp. NPDC058115]|uniref:MFS transporter n=1 Tax=Kitasatospora sp. NPDC058115 TaxID=3346347 RepID=UPI0036D8B6FE